MNWDGFERISAGSRIQWMRLNRCQIHNNRRCVCDGPPGKPSRKRIGIACRAQGEELDDPASCGIFADAALACLLPAWDACSWHDGLDPPSPSVPTRVGLAAIGGQALVHWVPPGKNVRDPKPGSVPLQWIAVCRRMPRSIPGKLVRRDRHNSCSNKDGAGEATHRSRRCAPS